MSIHSVPCWSLLDKDPLALVLGYPSVRFLLRCHTHFPLTLLPHDDGVPSPLFPNRIGAREIRVHLGRSHLGTTIHCSCLTHMPIFISPGAASPSIQVLTFGRSMHPLGTTIQVHFALKTSLLMSFSVREYGPRIGVHLLENTDHAEAIHMNICSKTELFRAFMRGEISSAEVSGLRRRYRWFEATERVV